MLAFLFAFQLALASSGFDAVEHRSTGAEAALPAARPGSEAEGVYLEDLPLARRLPPSSPSPAPPSPTPNPTAAAAASTSNSAATPTPTPMPTEAAASALLVMGTIVLQA